MFLDEGTFDLWKLLLIFFQRKRNSHKFKKTTDWLIMINDKCDKFLNEKYGKVPEVDGFIDELNHGLEDFELFWNFVEELIEVVVFDFG